MKNFFLDSSILIADKGGIPGLPPWSIPAIEKSLELGAHVISVPVRLTADKKIVVCPGENLTDLAEEPSRYSLAELQQADAAYSFDPAGDGSFPWRGKGLSLFSLEEVLSRFAETRFHADIIDRDPVLVREFCAVVEKLKAGDRILAASQYGSNIKIVRECLPGTATCFTPMGIVGFYALFRSGLLYFRKKFRDDAIFIPEAIGPSYMANSILIREARKRGLHVYIWNARTLKEVERLMSFGVSGFITDDVAAMGNLIKEARVRVDGDDE